MKKIPVILMTLLIIYSFSIPTNATELTEETTEHPQTTEYPNEPEREPDLVSAAAIVMDAATGQVLYEKNAHEKKYPASTTKILTTAIALEQGIDFNKTITMSENAIWGVDRDSSLLGVDVGEKITLEDIVYATMLKSANECAYALAEYISGDVESFSKLMNKKAAEIGCENSHFVTPNGLPDENHYTTAYDMALITKYALQNDTFRKVAGTLYYTVPPTNLTDETRPFWNGNKMINQNEPYYYEYCEGGKTGYTTASNNTLVTYSKKDGLELICVIMDCDGAPYAYSDSKALYNYCYNNYSYFHPLSDFSFQSDNEAVIELNVILDNYYSGLNHDLVDLKVDNDFSLLINRSTDITKIEHDVVLYNEARENVLGEIVFFYEGEQIGSTPITTMTPPLSSQMVKEEEVETTSIWKTVGKIMIRILIVAVALSIVLILYTLFASLVKTIKHRRKRRRYRRKRKKRDDDYYF